MQKLTYPIAQVTCTKLSVYRSSIQFSVEVLRGKGEAVTRDMVHGLLL